ncbi:MAG: GGDEF domain-containing protein [Rhodocyclales bacterium]|nr:GGDEF domain-containing protein [Rhodocyclales bacterium]
MIEKKQPATIAREALKQLNVLKLAPTPANYQACYNEIANLPNVAGFPEAPLRQLSLALTARNPDQGTQLELLDTAIGQRSWQKVQDALVAFTGASKTGTPNGGNTAPVMSNECMTNLANAIENILPALGNDDERFSAQVAEFLQVLRDPSADAQGIEAMFADFSHRVSIAAEEQAEIKVALLKLLHLIIENIGELSLDDSWLKGQIDALLIAVMPPLTLRRLDDVERRIREVMFKQTEAKSRSMEAQEEMRMMLSAFIERLSMMNNSSNVFQDRIEKSARQIEQVKTIGDMAPLLKDVIDATRAMAEDARNAHDQLQTLQEKALTAESELIKLHLDLDQASALARHDPLTDVLNRKGLDEALAKEIANMLRKDAPLSISMLDIDNFKKLNDRLGHETGDEALVHLVKVAREFMRPADSMARYGGEEFVILMPDTTLDKGVQAMKRLQRELTRAFFLAGTEKILITFSAGVAQLTSGESGAEAIKRADHAMYMAKRAGKNRVLGA